MTKPKIIFISLVVVIVTSLGASYWHWTGTPTYSLQQIQKALDNKDVVKFEKHVDINSISSRLIDDLVKYAMKESQSQDEFEDFGMALATGFVHLMKPHLIDSIHSQTIRQVEKGNFGNFTPSDGTNDTQEINIDEISEQIGADKESFAGISYIKNDGKVALAGLGFQNENYDREMILELRLRNMGRYWQIVELTNVAELLQELETAEVDILQKSAESEQLSIPKVDVRDISLENIRQYFVANERVGDLFVIEGMAVNNHGSKPAIITIKAQLFDLNGQVIADKDFVCGKIASLIDLQTSSRDDLEAILTFEEGALSEDSLVEPKKSIQFMTVFYNPSQAAQNFELEVVKVSSP